MAFVDSELQIATDLAVQAVTLCSNIIQTAIREQSLISSDANGSNTWDIPVHEMSPGSPYYTHSYHPHSHRHRHQHHQHHQHQMNPNNPPPPPLLPSSRHYNNSSSSVSNDNMGNNLRTSQRHSYYRQSNLTINTSNNSFSNCNSNSNSNLPQQQHHQHKVPHPPPLSPFPLSSPQNSQLQSQSQSQSLSGQVDNDELCSSDETHTEHPECTDKDHAQDVTMTFVDEQEEMWCSQIAYSCEEAMINVLQSNTPLYNIVNVNNLYEEEVPHAHSPFSWQKSNPFSSSNTNTLTTPFNRTSISNSNNNNPTWVIMPVYSPRSCWRRDPYTCTSIALLVKDTIYLSLISVPCLNEMYSAVHGRGAFCNGQRIHVSNVCNLHGAVVFLPEPFKKRAKVSFRSDDGDDGPDSNKNGIPDAITYVGNDENKVTLSEESQKTENVENKEIEINTKEKKINSAFEQNEKERLCQNKSCNTNSPTSPVLIKKKKEKMNENSHLNDQHEEEEEEEYHKNNEYCNLFALLQVQVALSKIPVHSLRQINNPLVSCAFVAAGRAEVFFNSHMSRFACAAGELLITEAGGVVMNVNDTENYLGSDANKANGEIQQTSSYRSLKGICVCNNNRVAEELQTVLRDNKYSV